MESEQDLRRSGRSTRRSSIVGDTDSYDDEVIQSGLSTPPLNTPKKSRKSSLEDQGSGLKILNSSGIDESKHSFQFIMTREAFIKDLYSFMHARGQPISKLPSLGYQELDLFLLYQLVIARGGMDEVTRKQEWKLVYQDLGIPTMSTSASYNTRTNYKKYLYLYELEHCDFPDKNRPKDSRPKYQISEFIRIVSSVFEGQVFYARILKSRFREGTYQYYVHYNGWNSSHDEWMREDVLDPLLEDERGTPELLANPPPSRSSKSNHLIYDPTVSEKLINNLVQKSPKPTQNPLSPASPAAAKKSRKATGGSSGFNYYESGYGPSSEEEEAANELITGMERYGNGSQRGRWEEPVSRTYQQQARPVEVLKYPMRSDPGEDIAKILEDKRDRPHEQDLIHRNRLHTHVLMKNGYDEDGRERRMTAELLKSVKIKIEGNGLHKEDEIQEKPKEQPKMSQSRSNDKLKDSSPNRINDPRSLHDIQESLVSLQASLLSTQTSYKHTMKALKKHHNIQVLPPLPVQNKKSFISTRRSSEKL